MSVNIINSTVRYFSSDHDNYRYAKVLERWYEAGDYWYTLEDDETGNQFDVPGVDLGAMN